ncbi:MAG: 3-oxoacyl-[acyl-carrier-protein] reductase [Planctomycetota bacterium]
MSIATDLFDFAGKRVAITGGSRGIGLEVARAFASRGARVALLARDPERAAEAASSLPGEARAWALNVAEESSVNDTFGAVVGEWGGLDVLVNNAGITRDNLVPMLKADDWDDVLATNLRGVFLCSRAVLRPMLRQRSGRIVNITSIVGLTGNAGQANYAAAKAGIIGFTKSLAKEIATRSVTVNAVAPGLIDTDMTRALTDEQRAQILRQIPAGRFGSTAEVASAVLFLASDAAGYVTGEVLRVDGGMAM